MNVYYCVLIGIPNKLVLNILGLWKGKVLGLRWAKQAAAHTNIVGHAPNVPAVHLIETDVDIVGVPKSDCGSFNVRGAGVASRPNVTKDHHAEVPGVDGHWDYANIWGTEERSGMKHTNKQRGIAIHTQCTLVPGGLLKGICW